MIFGFEIYEIITALLLLGSLFFFLASAIGMIRLPDVELICQRSCPFLFSRCRRTSDDADPVSV